MDDEISPRLQEVIEDFATEPSRPVRDTLLLLLSRVSRAVGLRPPQAMIVDSGEDTEEAEDDDEDYAIISDDEGVYNTGSFATVPTNQCDLSVLQR
jgi:ubiquitin-conjugating enzyme E2 Q